jgi:hypothetical protein
MAQLEGSSQSEWSRCGSNSLTTRDFWSHCENEAIIAMMQAAFNAVTIPNYGIVNHQTTGTEAMSVLLNRWLVETFAVFGLNGRKGLEESKAPEWVSKNFFCTEDKLEELYIRVLPEEMQGLWAAPNREGPPYQRYDTLAQFHALSLLAVPDLKFYYGGCSFQGMNGCQWAATPDVFWPSHLAPTTTIAELLALPLMEIALQLYNVDTRQLTGIIGLPAFAGVDLTIKQAIVSGFPSDQVSTDPWLCCVWFMLQTYIIGVLNASVCPMNYRFNISFLLGGGGWAILRWMSEMTEALNLASGGTIPIDQPTLFAAAARIMNYICSIYRENNRGGFQFRECDIFSSAIGSATQVTEPTFCLKNCAPLCTEPGTGVNNSTASNNGDALCQCPKCCIRECPAPCPPEPCPPLICDTCPTDAAPQCLPKLGDFVAAFIGYAYVVDTTSQLSSGTSGSTSSSSGPFSLSEPKEIRTISDRKSRDVICSPLGSGLLDSSRSGFHQYLMLQKSADSLENVFKDILKVTGSGRSSRLLAKLYHSLFLSIQPTSLAHDSFSINPSAIIEALTVQVERIFNYTLGRGTSALIHLNHSPMKIPRTAFTSIWSVLSGSMMQAAFIACTNDTQSGVRFDYATMVESLIRTANSDFWAYYRGKRLEGFPPCHWARLSSCYWSLNPDMTLQDALAHPIMGIYLRPYVLDNRAFTGIPGLSAFENVTLTLRQVLSNDNPVVSDPIAGQPWLDFLWTFIIQQGIAAYLNSTLTCIFYRLGAGGYVGYPFFVLRMISDMVYALNTTSIPQPPIDSPLVQATASRLLTFTDTIAHENARGVKHPERFQLEVTTGCPRRYGCTCTTACVDSPDPAKLSQSFVAYMTTESSD